MAKNLVRFLLLMSGMRTGRLQSIECAVLLAIGMGAGAHGQSVLTDQRLQPPAVTGGSDHYDGLIFSLLPATGQEFTPSLSGVDFIDINLQSPGAADTGTFRIALHEGNIEAPVLGLSDEVVKSGGVFGGDTRFTFPGTVPLVAGNMYVFEIIQVAGSSRWGVEIPISAMVDGQTIDMNYPGGRLIGGGVPQDDYDMIFQEGMIVPEPGVTTLCLLGILVFGFIRKARAKHVSE